MNVGAIRAVSELMQRRDTICDDVSRRAQNEQLLITRNEARLEHLRESNQITRARLAGELEESKTRLAQFQRAFSALKCKVE